MDILKSAAAAGILVAATVVWAMPMARAATADPGPAASGADIAACDRACLREIAERYLNAMLAHDPAKAPLAHNARYTENGVELALPDGLWRTLDKLGTYRLVIADPQNRSIGFLAKGLENGAPVLIGTRLRVIDHQITEMESVVARLSSTQGGSSFGTPKDASIDGEPRKQFLTDLPVSARRSAAELGAIVNGYFTGLEGNRGEKPPAFAEDCHRLENETPTTNNPVAPGAQPSARQPSVCQGFWPRVLP